MELKINPEFLKLVPRPTTEQYNSLKENIILNGLLQNIEATEDGTIIDGHTRFQICQELHKEIAESQITLKHFSSELDAKLYIIDVNLQRRHLNAFQRIELETANLELYREKGKQNLTRPRAEGTGKFVPNSQKCETGFHTDKIIAGRTGSSPRTVQQALKIIEKAPEDLKEKVRANKTSIAHAYTIVKTTEKHACPPALPEGQFAVILADPPYAYDLTLRGSPNSHYPVLDTDVISNLKIPVAENAILFLWATNPKLKDALLILEKWGFNYKTNLVWVKDKIGTGYYFRGQHELLLVGVRGKIGVPEEQNRPSSVLNAPRTEHSKKPPEIYELIERMYPNQKYLELYGRNKRQNWMVWGNEL